MSPCELGNRASPASPLPAQRRNLRPLIHAYTWLGGEKPSRDAVVAARGADCAVEGGEDGGEWCGDCGRGGMGGLEGRVGEAVGGGCGV